MRTSRRSLHLALLSLWGVVALLLVLLPTWLRHAAGDMSSEAVEIWRILAYGAALLTSLPMLGLSLILRGHSGGGALLAAVCALPLLPMSLSLGGALGSGGFLSLTLLPAAFLAANVWVGVQAASEAR